MNILSPSILAADCARMGEQIAMAADAGAKYLHIDVMDGHFVPSLSYGMCVVESLRKSSDLFFDVHLMITEPKRYLEEFVKAGADLITVHLEACSDVAETLKLIRELGVKVGISIKPKTPVEALYPYMEMVDMVLIMTVEPGFGGQKYIPESTERIHTVRSYIEEKGLAVDLEVDGGISSKNLQMVLDAGANVIVAGSAVFRGDISGNVREMMEIMNS